MKITRKINKIALIATLLLYLTIFLGLLSQIALGVIQIIIATYITAKYFSNSRYTKKHLSLYWSFVFLEFVLMLIFFNHTTSNDFYQILILMIFPMAIAIYFTVILNKITRNYANA